MMMSRDGSTCMVDTWPSSPMDGMISSAIDAISSAWRRKWRSDPQMPQARVRTSI